MDISGSILGPVIGASISGIIGVITVEYRNHRDKIAEIEGWYDQTIRLADQIERETPNSYLAEIRGEGEANETGERANDMAAAYGRIGDRLRDHVNRAPAEISESVIGPASETARHCRIVDREKLVSGEFLPAVEAAVKSAARLRESAEESKQNVGPF